MLERPLSHYWTSPLMRWELPVGAIRVWWLDRVPPMPRSLCGEELTGLPLIYRSYSWMMKRKMSAPNISHYHTWQNKQTEQNVPTQQIVCAGMTWIFLKYMYGFYCSANTPACCILIVVVFYDMCWINKCIIMVLKSRRASPPAPSLPSPIHTFRCPTEQLDPVNSPPLAWLLLGLYMWSSLILARCRVSIWYFNMLSYFRITIMMFVFILLNRSVHI